MAEAERAEGRVVVMAVEMADSAVMAAVMAVAVMEVAMAAVLAVRRVGDSKGRQSTLDSFAPMRTLQCSCCQQQSCKRADSTVLIFRLHGNQIVPFQSAFLRCYLCIYFPSSPWQWPCYRASQRHSSRCYRCSRRVLA